MSENQDGLRSKQGGTGIGERPPTNSEMWEYVKKGRAEQERENRAIRAEIRSGVNLIIILASATLLVTICGVVISIFMISLDEVKNTQNVYHEYLQTMKEIQKNK